MTEPRFPTKLPETDDGAILFSVPFPTDLNAETLAGLKSMAPIIVKQPYAIDYIHSYGQDSPFFAGLANGRLLGRMEPSTGYTYATPRGHDMYTGAETDWVDLTRRAGARPRVHRLLLRLRGVPAGVPVRPGADRVRRRGHAVPGPADRRRPERAHPGLDRHARRTALPPQQQVQADRRVLLPAVMIDFTTPQGGSAG